MEPPPTLEELVREVGISIDQLDQRCSDEHLKSISLFLDWRDIAPHLGLSERDSEDIEADTKTETGRRLKALRKWKKKYSFKATLKSLVVVLLTVGSADDAEKVCRLLQSQAGKHSASVASPTTPDTFSDCQPLPKTAVEHSDLCGAMVETSHVPIQHSEKGIENEIQEIEDQFLNVVKKAAKNLKTVELSDIKLCVTQLPVSVKYQYIKFLECKAAAINDARSVDEIFILLGRHWDFLNCGLLNEIVRNLGNEATKHMMKKYTDSLRRFRMKTKLGDFIGKWARSTPPHFTEFVTKMGGDWKDRTLEDLEEFRTEFARSMYVKEYAMHFNSAQPGCIAVTWALQSSIPAIADSLRSAFQLLEKKYCVLRMIFQEKCIPDQKLLEPPPSAIAPVTVSPPTSLEREPFDIIDALLGAGVPYIAEQILSCLDSRSLTVSEQVSTLWRDVIDDLPIWQHLVKEKVMKEPLWNKLFKRRRWYKYLDVPLTKQMSSYYRQLYQTASKDIHSLETNWRKGLYTLTKIKTGNSVTCLQYDDSKIITGHGNGTIKILDRSTLQVSKLLKGHKDTVWCLQFNKEMVISGSYDHTVKVWDVLTGLMINNLLHHKRGVWSLKFTAKTLVTGSVETVAVWDVRSPTDITLRTVLKGEFPVDLSETIIISGSGNTIKVWDIFSGGLVRTLHGHGRLVKSLQLRGSHLISGSYDKTIRIWNVETGECLRVLHGHDGSVMCVAMDDKRLLSGSADQTVKVWDLAAALDPGSSSDSLCITTLKEHTYWVQGLQFDDFQVISGSDDKTIIVYDFFDPVPLTFRT